MHYDEFILTTEERKFELTHELEGILLNYQPSYECNVDSVAYNSVSIVMLENGDTITVYSPCQRTELKIGIMVSVKKGDLGNKKLVTKREIIKQFPKKSPYYPKWECISCKYPNTVGMVVPR